MRLDRFLGNLPCYNRQQVRLLLAQRRVRVDGLPPGDPLLEVREFNRVEVDEQLHQPGRPARYLMLHKPAGCVSATQDPQHRTVLDLLPEAERDGLHIAGRLDGTVADKVEVHGGFLRKPEGKDYGYVGHDQYETKYYGDGIGIGMRKGQKDLKEQINAAIKTIRSNGTYNTIAKKYFDFDPYGN